MTTPSSLPISSMGMPSSTASRTAGDIPTHMSRLYERVAKRKGHQKAIGAVARHMAEAVYWILTKNEPYRDP